MKLSKSQIEILDHRLSADVVAEVLADTEELGISLEEAQEAVKVVEAHVKLGTLPLEDLTPVQLEVVIDCLDGSTFFCDEGDAIALGQISRGRSAEWHKSANQLEQAVSVAAGRPVNCARR